MPKFSQRSKDALIGLHPLLITLLNSAIVDSPIDFTIIEGVRTAATQKKYYTWGRTVVNPNTGPLKGKPFGSIVTGRDGVKSKSEHQVKADGLSHAFDVCPFIDGKLAWDNTKAFHDLSKHIKAKAKELGIKITWGGDWKTLVDLPHYEL